MILLVIHACICEHEFEFDQMKLKNVDGNEKWEHAVVKQELYHGPGPEVILGEWDRELRTLLFPIIKHTKIFFICATY